jgi:glycosyltransferase involved in cell wall biosynthesis|tara:strand:- start:2333 stop:3598 length:1266 start_codon:yes stop_codon:yes gene_type:complete
MTKVVVSCPIDTYSGYGARSRDFVKALIDLKKYDVQILSQRWGNTRFGYLKAHNESDLTSRIIPNLTSKPDVWIQITVPNEFNQVGKYNIGVTAGMETTLVHNKWLEGCNRMDLILTSSTHSVNTFTKSAYEQKDKATDQVVGKLQLEKPIEVIFEGVDTTKYRPTKDDKIDLSDITEQFCYLFVGHWMQGDFGQDRKNVGYTIKSFLEAFKNKPKQPALILKAHQVGTSILDRERMLDKIEEIRRSVKGKLPNVYLLHGEVSDKEINALYNHPKVKVMVSLTKGEGFGRPLLEFATVGKPIIASGWSGQIDFLHREYNLLVGGDLKNVHKSAAQKEMILEESKWFTPNDQEVAKAYRESFKHYKKYEQLAKSQRKVVRDNFTYEHMVTKLGEVLNKSIPEFPTEVKLTLPKLNLPKLEKA